MKISISDDDFLRLPALVRHHAVQLDNAVFNKDYFSSIVWAAVTLEALLEDILEALEKPVQGKHGNERQDLGGMLCALESAVKESDRKSDGTMELISRAHTIRATRNIIVHNTGRQKKDMQREAEVVCEGLSDLLQWWLKEFSQPAQPSLDGASRVFLATINPDHPRHRAFLGDLKQALYAAGLEPVTVKMTEYDRKHPLLCVKNEMEKCDAVLIVGLERSRAYLVCDREGTPKQIEDKHRRYSSAWLQMEAGLAYGLGFTHESVFVMCEQNICSEGVFDRNWNEFTPIILPALNVSLPTIQETIRRIKQVVSEGGSRHEQ